MPEHYDSLETRTPTARAAEQLAAVRAQVQNAKTNCPAYTELLADVVANDIDSFDALGALPITRKSELAARQLAAPPFGGFVAQHAELKYVFASPGGLYETGGAGDDYWRFARALFAAGVRAKMLVHNCFSYHLTPAGAMCDAGCHALRCTVLPGGVGASEQQLTAAAHLNPDAYVGTPSFLTILLEKAAERGIELSHRYALLSGEALPPSTRDFFAQAGITARQAYATAELGLIAYETIADAGLIIDEQIYVEIIEPNGARPLPDGAVGEVAVTTFNPDQPLIRFATGDLSAMLPGTSECGRTNRRLAGWLGRADQTAKVRGMFVHPAQVAEICKRHDEIIRARLVINWRNQRDQMTLHCETDHASESLSTALSETIRDVCKLRGEVAWMARGELPDDGVVIEDAREYE